MKYSKANYIAFDEMVNSYESVIEKLESDSSPSSKIQYIGLWQGRYGCFNDCRMCHANSTGSGHVCSGMIDCTTCLIGGKKIPGLFPCMDREMEGVGRYKNRSGHGTDFIEHCLERFKLRLMQLMTLKEFNESENA